MSKVLRDARAPEFAGIVEQALRKLSGIPDEARTYPFADLIQNRRGNALGRMVAIMPETNMVNTTMKRALCMDSGVPPAASTTPTIMGPAAASTYPNP